MIAAIIATCLLLALIAVPKSTMRGLWTVWPSTVAHELSHFFVALFTGCRPSFPQLIARKEKAGKIVLGEVSFTARTIGTGMAALAPAWVLAPAAWFTLVHASEQSPVLAGVVAGYLAYGCLPSTRDFALAFSDPLGSAIAILLLGVLML